jgi:hypothetical protein
MAKWIRAIRKRITGKLLAIPKAIFDLSFQCAFQYRASSAKISYLSHEFILSGTASATPAGATKPDYVELTY